MGGWAGGVDYRVRDLDKREGVCGRVGAEEFVDGEVVVGITGYYVGFFGDEIAEVGELDFADFVGDAGVDCRRLGLMGKKWWEG